MDVITGVMLVFSVLGGLDRIFGSRFGLGKEFEKGFMLLGPLALSIIGMIVLAPWLAKLMEPALAWVNMATGIDPSTVTSAIFANDMGGGALAREIALDDRLGMFNGLVVASMMGVTVSFTIPFALNAVAKEQHEQLLLGLLCGVVTIPVGCFVGGLIQGVPMGMLLLNMLPLVVLSAVLAAGLMLFPRVCTVVFGFLGKMIQTLITFGLIVAIIRFLTGRELIPGLETIEAAGEICLNAAIVMSGAFPLLYIISRLLAKPLDLFARKLGINRESAMGFISCLANSMTTFEQMKDMDQKGVMLNSAFAVSTAFVLGDHLAFTLAMDGTFVPGMIVGKLVSGVLAVCAAMFLHRQLSRRQGK